MEPLLGYHRRQRARLPWNVRGNPLLLRSAVGRRLGGPEGPPLLQGKRQDAVAVHRVAAESTSGGGDHDVLLAIPPFVGHRRRLGGRWQLEGPQLCAALRVEGAETAVVGGAYEDQAAGCRDRTAVAGTSSLLLLRRQ